MSVREEEVVDADVPASVGPVDSRDVRRARTPRERLWEEVSALSLMRWLEVILTGIYDRSYLVVSGLHESGHDGGVVQWGAVLQEADLVAAEDKVSVTNGRG